MKRPDAPSRRPDNSPPAWAGLLAAALRAGASRRAALRRSCLHRPSRKKIHALRVQTRRLLALVTLAEAVSGMPARKLRRALKRGLRATGKTRDADVHLRHVGDLRKAHPEVAALRRHLRRHRRRAARRAVAKLGERKAGRHLTRLLRALQSPAETRPAGVMVSRTLAAAHAKATERAAAGGASPRELHRARLALKKLRHLAEAASLPRPARHAAWIKRLRQLQRLLGEIHDLHLLLERLDGFQTKRRSDADDLRRVRTLLAAQRQRLKRRYRASRMPSPPPMAAPPSASQNRTRN